MYSFDVRCIVKVFGGMLELLLIEKIRHKKTLTDNTPPVLLYS